MYKHMQVPMETSRNCHLLEWSLQVFESHHILELQDFDTTRSAVNLSCFSSSIDPLFIGILKIVVVFATYLCYKTRYNKLKKPTWILLGKGLKEVVGVNQ